MKSRESLKATWVTALVIAVSPTGCSEELGPSFVTDTSADDGSDLMVATPDVSPPSDTSTPDSSAPDLAPDLDLHMTQGDQTDPADASPDVTGPDGTQSDFEEVTDTIDAMDVADMDTEPPPPPPMPTQLDPCTNGSCWDTSLTSIRCGEGRIDENYSSGNYNVHNYATTLFEDVNMRIRVRRSAGNWAPAIIIQDAVGATIYDGSIGTIDPVRATLISDGRTGETAEVVLKVASDTPVELFVTSWNTADNNFVPFIGTDAKYTLTVTAECGMQSVACNVNGHAVGQPACAWLNFIGRQVVPQLPGSSSQQIDDAAVVAWWALKEGVLFLDNPLAYSNCNFPDGDRHIGPLDLCPDGRAWQVGASGVQVPNFPDLGALEQRANELYPGDSVEHVLRESALTAQLSLAQADQVVASTGSLRRSWLLRNSAIGFSFQVAVIRRECIDDSRAWCFGTRWDATANYAPTKSAALQSIADIKTIFSQLQ